MIPCKAHFYFLQLKAYKNSCTGGGTMPADLTFELAFQFGQVAGPEQQVH